MLTTYDVINLGNEGGEDGEYQIGSAHYTGKKVDLDNPTLANAVTALREIGALTDEATTETVTHYENEVGAFDSQSITLKDKATGLFLFELRPAQ